MRTVRERVGVLLKGCKCITGCKSRVCGCRKEDTNCTEGCLCINCENQALPSQDREDLADVALEEAVYSNTWMKKMQTSLQSLCSQLHLM